MRVAIVLAAGASRRMGRPKLELDLGGKTLVERSVQKLVGRVRRSRAVGRFRPAGCWRSADLAPTKSLEVIRNPNCDDRGLSSSLRAGLRALPKATRIVLVALADKPLVKPETIRKLLAVFEAVFENGGAKVVYPVYRGEQGHPVVWDVTLVDELSRCRGRPWRQSRARCPSSRGARRSRRRFRRVLRHRHARGLRGGARAFIARFL